LNCLRKTEVADLNALKSIRIRRNLIVGSESIGSAGKVSDPDCRIRMVSFYVAAENQRLSISPGFCLGIE
jgi:hypothetical protein